MDFRSILVCVDAGIADPGALGLAVDLARSFDARIIGAAAVDPVYTFAAIDSTATALDVYSIVREDAERHLAVAEERFRAAVPAGMTSSWHSAIANPSRFVASLATGADVIVTGTRAAEPLDVLRPLNVGELILSAGRPVIATGRHETPVVGGKVMIAWKDTREARRAVSDALPLLQRAREILVVTVTEGEPEAERASLDNLAAWLDAHGLKATPRIIGNPEGFEDIIESTALSEQADLVVAGGYGHSRMREWLFGGMTRSLLNADSAVRFFSN